MSDPIDIKSLPGMEAAMKGYETASKSMQSFAAEMQKMSKETLDHTSQLMEKLRGAKSVEDVVSVQTSFMQQSFASYTDYSRRFSEMMMELAKQNQSALQQGAEAMKEAAEKMKQTGEKMTPHHD